MIFIDKEQIEQLVDPVEMMDQIDDAYRVFGA